MASVLGITQETPGGPRRVDPGDPKSPWPQDAPRIPQEILGDPTIGTRVPRYPPPPSLSNTPPRRHLETPVAPQGIPLAPGIPPRP